MTGLIEEDSIHTPGQGTAATVEPARLKKPEMKSIWKIGSIRFIDLESGNYKGGRRPA